jgi:hypothetical protein
VLISADTLIFLVIAVGGSPALVTVISEILRGRRERKRDAEVAQVKKEAAAATSQAAIDGAKAQENAAIAQTQAAEAITAAVEAARSTDQRLGTIQKTGEIVLHHVNSQHVALLRVVADLRGQIARANPDDASARSAADAAQAAAEAAETEAATNGR